MIVKSKFIAVVITLYLSGSVCLGQIVTGSFDSYIPCCSGFPIAIPYIDSFDIENDTNCEFWIQGLIGVDNYGYTAISCDGVQLNEITSFGNTFPKHKWEWYASGMPNTVLTEWGDWWLPNSGPKYLGFRRINSIVDTTYGWVKLDFKEEPSGPFDTIFILTYAYSLTPNVHLTAGQTQLTSFGTVQSDVAIGFYPNPIYDRLNIANPLSQNFKIYLSDINGSLLETKLVSNGNIDFFDLSHLSSGIYVMNVSTENEWRAYRIIKH